MICEHRDERDTFASENIEFNDIAERPPLKLPTPKHVPAALSLTTLARNDSENEDSDDDLPTTRGLTSQQKKAKKSTAEV